MSGCSLIIFVYEKHSIYLCARIKQINKMEKISIVFSAAMATVAECVMYLLVFMMLCVAFTSLLLPSTMKK